MRGICSLLVATLGMCGLALAEEVAVTAGTTVEAQHEGLRKLQATMETALNSRDIDAILANVDEKVVFTTMNGDVARGRDAIREYFRKMMDGPDKVVESVTSDFIPDDLSILLDDHTAIATGKSDDHYILADGKKFAINGRWTAVLVRKEGRWLVSAFHYSANIFDNPILLLQRRMLLMYLGGGALVLAIVAFFVGRNMGRRASR